MKLFTISAVLALSVSSVVSAQSGEWVSLFDGKSFNGWSQAGGKAPDAGWQVEEGMIHLKGKGGNLLSEKQVGVGMEAGRGCQQRSEVLGDAFG
jgi:hypothetical protein